MSFKFRPHQKSDYKQLKKELKKQPHILFGASVGYGKSVVIHKFVKDALKKGGRVVVIAPRRKLVKQLMETLEEFYPSIIMGTETIYHKDSNVFVCSTPTLSARLKKFGKKYLGDITHIAVDEVHINFGTASMQGMVDMYWDKAKWVGLSATPIDERGYRLEGYDHTIYNYQMQDLIDMGWLTKLKVLVEETPKGLDQVGMVGGDYNESQLAEFMSDEARVNNVYEVWKKYAKKRKTMIFAVNIAHAEIILEDFHKHNVAAGITHSKLSDIEQEVVLNRFKSGELKALVNVSQLTTGFDMPSVDALIMARPTKSLKLFIQITGRILRHLKGKTDALFLDVAGSINQHGYPTMRRDFNKMRPPSGSATAVEFNDVVCPSCEYATQPRNCRREQIVEKHITINRTYCPNCGEIIDETTKDTKKIKKMALMQDPSKLSDKKVGKFVEQVREAMGYKHAWVSYVAKKYNDNDGFKSEIKMLYARYINEKANLTTSGNNIRNLMGEY